MMSNQQQESCSECDENATWYCVQDDANFCDEHNNIAHSLKSQKLHKIVSINEKNLIIENETAKPMDCKNHHMPLCLYCLSCKDVCCVACLSVDIHKEHSDQVKSVVDVANSERKILNENFKKIQHFITTFTDEQDQLQQALRDIDFSETESSQKIDREFDRIVACTEARRKLLKKQLQKKSNKYRDNIYLRQEDLRNINSSLNKCLEEGQHVLTLNDFAALSQSKTIIEKMNMLEMESSEYPVHIQLIDMIPFHISSQSLLEMINISGSVGTLPAPSFSQQKCTANVTNLDIEWEPLEYHPPITAYVLEVGQDNDNFKEVYRGLATKYHLKDLIPNTPYVILLHACHAREVGNTALLELRTLNADLNNWTLSMSSTYPTSGAEDTRESLLDGQLTTGAATDTGAAWIKASFPYPVLVNTVTIAPMHKNPSMWGPLNGNHGVLQYSHDNNKWTTVGTIAYVEIQQQKIEIGGVTAQYWRLFHKGYLGTSSFVFQ